MVNPFDRSFFKFLLGFICIILLSFAILYVVGEWAPQLDKQGASLLGF